MKRQYCFETYRLESRRYQVLDFTSSALMRAPEVLDFERKEQRDSRKWHRVLRELRREELGVLGFVATSRRRRELRNEFVSALDSAHAAGMTIDAYMARGARVVTEASSDPALSERAEWAGLNDAA
jgi:hypothetical protein